MFEGKKVALYNFIKVIGATLVAMGALPPEAVQYLIDHIETILASGLAIEAIISGVLRHFTTTEPFWRRQ